ncbi:MAG: polymer-forming cytoskeletal protein [Haloplanus sp.]
MGSPVRRLALLAVVTTLLLAFGTGIAAADSARGVAGTVVVGQGETYDSVESVAGSVVVRGTVTGDVSALAGDVYVTDTGRVGGDVSAAAGTVRVDGVVGGDVNAAAGTVELGESARVGGNFAVGAGYVSVDGAVGGDARVGAETVVLGPNATIGGEFRYDAETFTRDPGATVAGGVVRDDELGGVGPVGDGLSLFPWFGAVYGLFVNLLLGAGLLLVFPAFSARVASRVATDPVVTGGVGLLTVLGVPVVLVLLAVTVVGIPLSVLGAVGFTVAVWVALVYGQFAVGAWALGVLGREDRWLALVVGLVGFALLGAVPVVGTLFELAAVVLGLGALALGLRESYRGRGDRTIGGRQATLDEGFDDASAR